jgi:hypothetical protein
LKVLSRLFAGLLAAAATLVLGYFGYQRYLKWMVEGQTGPGKYQ